MRASLQIIISISILSTTSLLASVICQKNISYEYRFKGKRETLQINYCENKELNYFVSEGCHKSQQCLNLNEISSIKYHDLFSEVGTPGFRLCHRLKGKPIIGSYTLNGKRTYKELCLFDKEFVGVSTLVHFTRN